MREAFEPAVRSEIARLSSGEVVTYGDIAEAAGYPGAARAVGSLLSKDGADLPWWRVVTANGRLVPGYEREHARRLRAEGIVIRKGRVLAPDARRKRGALKRGPGDS